MAGVDRTAAKRRAATEWADLRDRLRTVTPQAIGRAVVVVTALAGGFWLTTCPTGTDGFSTSVRVYWLMTPK